MSPEALAALHASAFTDTPRPWTAAEFARFLGEQSTLLATAEGGFALGRAIGPEAELLTLAVHPLSRRTGIGLGLLASFEQQAARAGAEEALLEVATINLAARQLYFRAGYVLAGRRIGYYIRTAEPPVDALVLRKPLVPGKII